MCITHCVSNKKEFLSNQGVAQSPSGLLKCYLLHTTNYKLHFDDSMGVTDCWEEEKLQCWFWQPGEIILSRCSFGLMDFFLQFLPAYPRILHLLYVFAFYFIFCFIFINLNLLHFLPLHFLLPLKFLSVQVQVQEEVQINGLYPRILHFYLFHCKI